MTTTGKVFKAYAEAITARHGFGSSKMVKENSPDFISKEIMKGQGHMNRANWHDDAEERAAGLAIWRELEAAEKWLIENGWLKKYEHFCHVNYGIAGRTRGTNYIGLTAKGWAVANKYMNA